MWLGRAGIRRVGVQPLGRSFFALALAVLSSRFLAHVQVLPPIRGRETVRAARLTRDRSFAGCPGWLASGLPTPGLRVRGRHARLRARQRGRRDRRHPPARPLRPYRPSPELWPCRPARRRLPWCSRPARLPCRPPSSQERFVAAGWPVRTASATGQSRLARSPPAEPERGERGDADDHFLETPLHAILLCSLEDCAGKLVRTTETSLSVCVRDWSAGRGQTSPGPQLGLLVSQLPLILG
jgi:hypothetical protein